MATFTKPTVVPNWATTSGNVSIPSAGKRNAGWASTEIPASDIENWNKRTTGEWLEWINERFGDGISADELSIISPFSLSEMMSISEDLWKWTSAAGIELNAVAGIFTIGRSITNGINLKGVGNLKEIEFDGTLNRMSYDISTDVWSLYNDSATASMKVSKTTISLDLPVLVTISATKEFSVVSGRVTAGPTSSDGIHLKGAGNLKEIEFNGTLNRMSYDITTDTWSLYNNSATASMTVDETDITLKKATTIEQPLTVSDNVTADDYLFTIDRERNIGPAQWTSDGAANLQTGGGLFEALVATDVSETSVDLDSGDRITGISVFASQAAAGTLTLSLHTINSVGAVSAAIGTPDTSTSTGALVNLAQTGLTETLSNSKTYMLRVVSSGAGVIKIGNTFITYDRPV